MLKISAGLVVLAWAGFIQAVAVALVVLALATLVRIALRRGQRPRLATAEGAAKELLSPVDAVAADGSDAPSVQSHKSVAAAAAAAPSPPDYGALEADLTRAKEHDRKMTFVHGAEKVERVHQEEKLERVHQRYRRLTAASLLAGMIAAGGVALVNDFSRRGATPTAAAGPQPLDAPRLTVGAASKSAMDDAMVAAASEAVAAAAEVVRSNASRPGDSAVAAAAER